MGDIRFLGRARGGRCVYCHDSLSGDVRTCPECAATWHEDCGVLAPRCPTMGCGGPAPSAATRPGPSRVVPASTRDALDPDRPRPGAGARLGPYWRLALSAVVNALVAAGSAAFLAWPIVGWTSFWSSGSVVTTIELVLGLGIAAFSLYFTSRWLRRVPGVFREVSGLLADTRPTAMRLTVVAEGSGRSTTYVARLSGAGESLEINISMSPFMTPDWLRKADAFKNEPVLVYGLPPPGPYVIEFRDGSLALVHPD